MNLRRQFTLYLRLACAVPWTKAKLSHVRRSHGQKWRKRRAVTAEQMDCKDHPGLYPKGPCIGTECRYPECLVKGTRPPENLRDRLARQIRETA